MEAEANATLNLMLGQEFSSLGIKYEQATWDEKKNKEGKPLKRNMNITDIEALEPFHWGYEFSEIFRKKDGFDAIITNPPWEVFKPESKEFFAEYSSVVTKNKMDLKTFDKEKAKILEDKEVLSAWLEYQGRFPHLAEYFRKSKQFQNQTSIINGKKAAANNNLYKLFLEQSFNLLRKGGYCGIVIPASIYTDIGSKQLRELLFDSSKITGLFCFENRREIFEGVHRHFKFVVLSFEKGGKTKSFPSVFMRHDVSELANFPQYGAVNINVDVVKKLSPDAYSLFEFKSESEANILQKIFAFPPLNAWRDKAGLEFSREFNAADDDFRFNENGVGYRIYEGKMIWHFTSYFSAPGKWIKETEFKKTHFFEKGDWKKYRIAVRRVSASTNERTLVTTLLPKNIMTSHSLFVNVKDILTGIESVYLTSILNSFVLDFVMRNQATTNITQFLIYQLPVPRLKPKDKWFQAIVGRAARLICTTEEFSELWDEVMGNEWTGKKAAITEYERNILRAELDGIIAHIYGLTEEEFAYILSTFPIVPQPQKVATQNAYRDVERGLIKPN
jgi:Alw26I/Eco31I/Esp3I family type II restriction m6 adenine DNA methyltransferase